MPSELPIIGVIACGREVEGEPAQAVKHRYLEAVLASAGAAAITIPTNQPDENAAAVVARLDAVLLTGSNSNIDPRRYGSADAAQQPQDPGRDSFGSAMIHAAISRGKPLFGICRGLQEINVALGGSLRDLRMVGSLSSTHHAPGTAGLVETFAHSHPVAIPPGSILERCVGVSEMLVNSVHYQAIDRLGKGLVVNATSPDGVIEAIWASDTPAPVFAVQWHPEWRPNERPHDLAFWNFLGEAARTQYVPAASTETTI